MQETQNPGLEQQIAALQEQLRKKNEQQGQRVETATAQEVSQPAEAPPDAVTSSVESVPQQPNVPVSLPPKPPAQGDSSSLKWLDVPFFMAEDVKRSYELPEFAPLLQPFQADIDGLSADGDHKIFSKALLEEVNKVVATGNEALVDALHDWLVEKRPNLVKYFCEGVV